VEEFFFGAADADETWAGLGLIYLPREAPPMPSGDVGLPWMWSGPLVDPIREVEPLRNGSLDQLWKLMADGPVSATNCLSPSHGLRLLQAEWSHSGRTSWTTAATVNGHSTVGLRYDRFTLKTGYSAINVRGPAANDRMGSRRTGTSDPIQRSHL
jgi:hypothetical protein